MDRRAREALRPHDRRSMRTDHPATEGEVADRKRRGDDDEGTEIEVNAVVRGETEDGHTQLDLTATCRGEKVLAQARATVRTR